MCRGIETLPYPFPLHPSTITRFTYVRGHFPAINSKYVLRRGKEKKKKQEKNPDTEKLLIMVFFFQITDNWDWSIVRPLYTRMLDDLRTYRRNLLILSLPIRRESRNHPIFVFEPLLVCRYIETSTRVRLRRDLHQKRKKKKIIVEFFTSYFFIT